MKNPVVSFQTAENLQTITKTDNFLKSLAQGRDTRKKLYRWHRIIGIITIVPVIFWTLSGLMHPFMAHWFKPEIAREFIIPKPVLAGNITLSLQQVLDKHSIVVFKQAQLVDMQSQTYYQIQTTGNQRRYFHAQTGEELKDGDRVYAEYLARYFADDQQAAIKSAQLLTYFTDEYKYINRLLPVWKISFDRPDGLDVYVETASSRMGTFNTNSRKAFLWIFDTFHNWSFIGAISNNTARVVVMMTLLGIIIASAISGLLIYGLFWKQFRSAPAPRSQRGILRRYHRQIGIATAFVTLTFAGSGAYHVSRKLQPNLLPKMVVQPDFERSELVTQANALPIDFGQLVNFSLAKIGKEAYYRVVLAATEDSPAAVRYFSAATGAELPDADLTYAKQLVKKFSQMEGMAAAGKAISCCETDSESASP
ncbi:PepSY domain-containing protein, partial [Rhodoflexus sp.]